VKNTGRLKELLLPGSNVVLAKSGNPTRKTQYDLIAVYKDGLGWVNIDSQAPNQVVKEWLDNAPALFKNITLLKPEYPFGKSRMDFYLECAARRIFIEVKGCTLERDGIGYFPDAPTARGAMHLYELAEAARTGYECYIAFVIAMPGVRRVLPNVAMDPEFGTALVTTMTAGVKVLHLPCYVWLDEISIADVVISTSYVS